MTVKFDDCILCDSFVSKENCLNCKNEKLKKELQEIHNYYIKRKKVTADDIMTYRIFKNKKDKASKNAIRKYLFSNFNIMI